MLSQRLAAVGATVSLLFLSSCSFEPTFWLEDYLSRLGRVTGQVSSVELTDTLDLQYPQRRERVAPLEESTMGVVRSLQLGKCGLADLVGERNSGLGKVMAPSRRLAYEVEFARRARRCLPELRASEGDSRFVSDLVEALEVKERNLPELMWNATFGSDEMASVFAQSGGAWTRRRARVEEAEVQVATLIQVLDDLGALPRLVDTALNADTDQRETLAAFERVEERLAAGQTRGAAGRLFLSLAVTGDTLSAAAQLVSTQECSDPITRDQREDSEILLRVFQIFYLGEESDPLDRLGLQEFTSRLDQMSQRFSGSWTSARAALLATVDPETDEEIPGGSDGSDSSELGADFGRRLEDTRSDFRLAVAEHVVAWQGLFDRCGLDPLGGAGIVGDDSEEPAQEATDLSAEDPAEKPVETNDSAFLERCTGAPSASLQLCPQITSLETIT